MKTILVDAINGLVLDDGTIFSEMFEMLETFPNNKIVLTGANDEQFKQFNLDKVPYEVFTLKHDPEKTDPNYYKILLEQLNLSSKQVIYFDHNLEAVRSAESLGVNTYHYNHISKDIKSLKEFIESNL